MTAPDYFTYLRAFDTYILEHPELLPSDVVLYLALLMLANKYRRFSFPAKRDEILARTRLNPHTYGKSRERLSAFGLVSYQAGVGGTKMATFTLLPILNRVYFNTDTNTEGNTDTNTVISTDANTDTNTNNNLYPYPNTITEVVVAPPPPSKKVAENIIMDWQPTEEKKPPGSAPPPDWPREFSASELQQWIETKHGKSWQDLQITFGQQLDMDKAMKDWCLNNADKPFADRRHPYNSLTDYCRKQAENGGNRKALAGTSYQQRTQTMINALDLNDYDQAGNYIGRR